MELGYRLRLLLKVTFPIDLEFSIDGTLNRDFLVEGVSKVDPRIAAKRILGYLSVFDIVSVSQ